MAPEPGILKRVRNRPAEWWAAPQTPTKPQTTQPSPSLKEPDRALSIADISANKGKVANRRGKGSGKDEENRDPESVKPLRRGRSSAEGKEIEDLNAAANIATEARERMKGPAISKQSLSKQGGSEDLPGAVKRRKAPRVTEAGGKDGEDVPAQESTASRKQGPRHSQASTSRGDAAQRRDKQPAPQNSSSPQTLGDKAPTRRGRSSNTESELQPVNYKETKTVKRASLLDAEAKPQSSGTTASQSKSKSSQDVITGKGSSKRSTRRDSEVQTATSNFSRSRATAKPQVVPTAKTKVKEKTSSTTTNSMTSKRARNEPVAPSQNAEKSRRMSEKHTVRRKRKSGEDPASEAPPPKRQRGERAIENTQLDEAPSYQRLSPKTRKVSRATIDSTWDSLPAPCIDRVTQFLQDAQRPVVVRIREEQKQSQASTALQMISRRLVSKISRGLPFPKSTRSNREDDFDFEKILDHNRALESQLTPALHSNELLEAELVREKALLEAEEAFLGELEGNAKAESVKRRQNARKLHPLLYASGPAEKNDLEDDIGLDTSSPIRSTTFNLLQDENLQAVVSDLQGHVDSIGGNLMQVQGITNAMAQSKAAVQATLFGCLDSAHYEDVVLG